MSEENLEPVADRPKSRRQRRGEDGQVPKRVRLHCEAIMRGEIPDRQFGRRVVEVGDDFVIEDPTLFSHRWMKPLDFDPDDVPGIPAPRRFEHVSVEKRRQIEQATTMAMAIKMAQEMDISAIEGLKTQ